MSEDTPIVAQKGPFPVEVRAGQAYFWCACGRSQTQPYCDGSHKGTVFQPQKWVPEKDGRVFFCGCKASATQPLCDGSHNGL